MSPTYAANGYLDGIHRYGVDLEGALACTFAVLTLLRTVAWRAVRLLGGMLYTTYYIA